MDFIDGVGSLGWMVWVLAMLEGEQRKSVLMMVEGAVLAARLGDIAGMESGILRLEGRECRWLRFLMG